jgi:hypothetical protein
MHLSNHAELIAVLTELWTLLDMLAIVKPGALQLPPFDTGLHPLRSFHAEAALAAGFDPEAVAVMSALPYLHVESDMGQRAIEIAGSTFPLSYLHFDKDDFADNRELFFDDENLIPPSAFRLTWQDVNGWEYIYDSKQSLLSSFDVLAVVILLMRNIGQGSCMSGIRLMTAQATAQTTSIYARCHLVKPFSRL